MTRIVAGAYGGRTLATPKGSATRPTSERVREALFSRLDHLGALEGASVLDLYAGSGALAFEALSRGARRAVLVEAVGPVAGITWRNARDLGCSSSVEVVAAPVERFLGGSDAAASVHAPYSLVFADPPYDVGEAALTRVLGGLVLPGRLRDDAVVVVERSSRSPEPTWPAALERFDERVYGETRLWFAEPVEPG